MTPGKVKSARTREAFSTEESDGGNRCKMFQLGWEIEDGENPLSNFPLDFKDETLACRVTEKL